MRRPGQGARAHLAVSKFGFETENANDAPERKPWKVLRGRKKKPLHPEEIHALLKTKADAAPPEVGRVLRWTLVLTRDDESKHFVTLKGSRNEACEQRKSHMKTGKYYKCWLNLETGGAA
jgi:hypothetical protein